MPRCIRRYSFVGQARKSLWIETLIHASGGRAGKVRLVRACGSKPGTVASECPDRRVRLVRACGSKPNHQQNYQKTMGQARKSLWIETVQFGGASRAEVGQARKSLWIETDTAAIGYQTTIGQARKSLWIETLQFFHPTTNSSGQARKSLWIETCMEPLTES